MTPEQQELFNFLVEYVTDENTALFLIKGGEIGFVYGHGGYIKDPSDDYYNEQIELGSIGIDDVGLSHRYMIGILM